MKKLFILSAVLCTALSAKADWSSSIAYSCTSDEVTDFDVQCQLDYYHHWARITKDNIDANRYSVYPNLVIPEKIKYNDEEFTVVEYMDEVWDNVSLNSVTFPSTLRRAGKLSGSPTLNIPSIEMWCACDNYTGVTEISSYNFQDGTVVDMPTIPEGIEKIGYGAFHYYFVNSITLPSTLRTIGDYAFAQSHLSSIDFPEGLTSIGVDAFWSNENLTSITLPNSLYELGYNCFGQSGLESIHFGESLTDIGPSAFWGCKKLKAIELPSTIELICNGAFSYCDNLEQFIIGSGVKEIEAGVFYNTPKLTKIACLAEEVPAFDNRDGFYGHDDYDTYNYVGDKTLYVPENLITAYHADDCWNHFKDIRPLSEFYTTTVAGNVNIALDPETLTATVVYSPEATGDITIPGSVTFMGKNYNVTAIGDEAFYNVPIGSVTLTSNLVTIGANAFAGTVIKAVDIPSCVTTIGDGAFSTNDLKDVLLGSGVQTIGSKAFSSSSLTLVTSWAESVPTAAADAFGKSIPPIAILRVPAGCEDAYAAAEPWSKFTNRGVDATIPCTKPTVRYADGKVLIECSTPGAICRYDVYGSGSTVDNQIPEIYISTWAEAENRTSSERAIVNLIDLLPMDGDVNNNGEITISDVTSLVNKILCK